MANGEKLATDMGADGGSNQRATAKEEQDHPPHHGMSASEYLATRFTSLKPPMTKAPNPIRLLRMITRMQWAFFTVAFIAWVSPPPIRESCQSFVTLTLLADLGCL